jgi:hypothetical protein
MVKFTPKSFTPGNIFKGVRNTMLTTMTGGVYLALPKSVKKTMENVANVAIPVVAGGVAAVTLGPAVMGMIGPKLATVASALGKNISSIGKGLFDVLGKLPASKQTEIAQQVTPSDIAYAEQHGQFPPRFLDLVSQAEQQAYGYAANQSLVSPTGIPIPPATNAMYADKSLYPGLEQAYQQQMADMQQSVQGENISSGTVLALVGGASLFAYLLARK